MNLATPFQTLCLVLTGTLLDFFDGYFAKILNVKSKIGAQLDSFSDLITFSLVPSLFIFDFLQSKSSELDFLPFLFILIVPFSMIRLARFNSLPSKSYFLGLPTPANGIFFMGIPFLSIDIKTELLVVILIISCFLLVSNIKLESFKKNSEKTGKNLFYVIITVLLILTTLILFLLNYSLLNLITLSIVVYLFSSLIFNFYKSF